jgi:hypothetical protein
MSETAKQLFESLKAGKEAVQAMAPGLENFGAEFKAEFSRLGTQGAMELASALFNGDAFVPYGPGQYTPEPQLEQGQAQEHDMGRER